MRSLKLILGVWIFAGCSGELPVSDFVGGTATLAAEEYQREIMEIDRLVFSEEKIGEGPRTALASKLESLSSRVDSARGDSVFLGIQARELNGLAARIRRIPSGRPVPPSVRDYWMRIRSNVFDDRAWFARSAADLTAPEMTAAMTTAMPAIEPEALPTVKPPVYQRGTGPLTILEGRWRATAITMNGSPSSDPEISGSWWIFQGEQLLIYGSDSGDSVGRYRFQIVSDEEGSALRVESQPGSERRESGWMIYELKGDELRLAFFDGLRERPEGFEPESETREPELVVVALTRA